MEHNFELTDSAEPILKDDPEQEGAPGYRQMEPDEHSVVWGEL